MKVNLDQLEQDNALSSPGRLQVQAVIDELRAARKVVRFAETEDEVDKWGVPYFPELHRALIDYREVIGEHV